MRDPFKGFSFYILLLGFFLLFYMSPYLCSVCINVIDCYACYIFSYSWIYPLPTPISVFCHFSHSVVSLQPHGLRHTRLPSDHHQLSELTQTHVHGVSDAIRPSHLLSSPSPAFSLSQHQGLLRWVSSSHQVARVLEFQLQHQSFQWLFRTDFLQDWLVWSPRSPRHSQESSPTPQQKH